MNFRAGLVDTPSGRAEREACDRHPRGESTLRVPVCPETGTRASGCLGWSRGRPRESDSEVACLLMTAASRYVTTSLPDEKKTE
ncbi:hypothetical protein [Streptomyces buecherae]|uniref:hypothetical protein n=1 Tax=Streptomyces buecherae TaxID=2763006 RepID=UPI0037BC3382